MVGHRQDVHKRNKSKVGNAAYLSFRMGGGGFLAKR